GLPVVFPAPGVALVGVIIWQGLSRDDGQQRPPAETRRSAVPASWRTFQDPDGTYRLSFPPTWKPTDRGAFIDFTEPGGERFFRVQPTTDGMAPPIAQRSLERLFAARHPGDDYRQLRLDATTFRGIPAAEWEFTFLDEGRLPRGYDITFIAAAAGTHPLSAASPRPSGSPPSSTRPGSPAATTSPSSPPAAATPSCSS